MKRSTGPMPWVEREHPGSLPLLAPLAPQADALDGYRGLEWWWIGCESGGPEFPWPFDADVFKNLLPGTQTSRGATWLAFLEIGGNFEADLIGCRVYEEFRVTATPASLCAWLHGFEGASGNGYNHFEAVYAAGALGLNFQT